MNVDFVCLINVWSEKRLQEFDIGEASGGQQEHYVETILEDESQCIGWNLMAWTPDLSILQISLVLVFILDKQKSR